MHGAITAKDQGGMERLRGMSQVRNRANTRRDFFERQHRVD